MGGKLLRKKSFAEPVGREPFHDAEIGIYGGEKYALVIANGVWRSTWPNWIATLHCVSLAMTCLFVPFFDCGIEIPFRAVADVGAVGFDVDSEERKTVPNRTEYDLVGMEGESEFFTEKILDWRNEGLKELLALMDEDEIVHISPVVAYFEGFLDELVERMEVEIGENLAREVADGETDSRRSEEEALVPRESLPIRPFSLDDAILGRIVGYDGSHEETERFGVLSPVLCVDDVFDHPEENGSVDGHEKSSYVEFENPCFLPVVVGCRPHKPLHALYPEGCPFSCAAGVRVVDEEILKYRIQFVDDKMVDDAVSEISRENLSFDGAVDDESNAFADGIRPVYNIRVESNEIRFVVELEFDGIGGVALVASAVVVGEEEFGEIHYFG